MFPAFSLDDLERHVHIDRTKLQHLNRKKKQQQTTKTCYNILLSAATFPLYSYISSHTVAQNRWKLSKELERRWNKKSRKKGDRFDKIENNNKDKVKIECHF